MKIYCIRNSVNSKVYVGQCTRSIELRWREHKLLNGKCRAIESAIRKYGADAFSIEQVAVAETQAELNALEQVWIEKLNSISPHGYNIKGGGGGIGSMHDETKAIMSSLAKRPHRLAQFEEMRKDPEVRAKMTQGLKARWADPEYKQKTGDAISGALNNPEVKIRRGQALRTAWAKPENKRTMIAARAEVALRPEVRVNRAAGISRAWNEPGAREKRGAAIKAAKSTPEFKARYAATNATPETKARRSVANSGRIVSAETRAKQSLRLKGKKRGPNKNGVGKPRPAYQAKWDDPAWKAMMIAKRHASEAKRKASIAATNALPETKLRRSLAAAKWQAERKLCSQTQASQSTE